MIFYMHDESKPYIVSLDIEHDERHIIQLSAIMLKNIGPSIYQICRSLNVYIKTVPSVSRFVQSYTEITDKVLDTYGVTLAEAVELWDTFVGDIDKDDILLFSHGIYQDSELMYDHGFDVNDYEMWDTLIMSKQIFEREDHLTLQELVTEAGFPPIRQHNAYGDAFSNLMLYSYLLKLQGDE